MLSSQSPGKIDAKLLDGLSIICFATNLVLFLAVDYIVGAGIKGRKLNFKIKLEEEYIIELNLFVRLLLSVIKAIPKNLIVSIILTGILFLLFRYPGNIINHLGLLGSVIAVLSILNPRKDK